jgi:hypothetical protein
MKNTRRRFIRSASLTATGLVLISPGVGANKRDHRRSAMGCAPQKSFSLAGTITSVQSGNWSDPATWGGKIPATTDTPLIASGHIVVYDLALATTAGINISSGAMLSFDPSTSTTLQITANVVVEGKLQMRPATATVIQTLRFTGIDESKYVGGGMNVLDTDTGLWVMGSGQLELAGTSKTSWTRTTGSIASGATGIGLESTGGWLPGDEICITPTEPPTAGAVFSSGFDESTVRNVSGSTITLSRATSHPHPVVNGQWAAEVMNLTRNVRIEGTATGRAHVFIRSTVTQTIKYTAFRYMGPRRNRGGDGASELVAGRYGLHFHHAMDGSRGSLIEGNVMRDIGNHSYVPHVSHGIKFFDNIAYNVTETAFWWDPGDPTHDVIYDHNIVALCRFVTGSLNMNAEDSPTFASSGFALNTGDGNICKNNVVVAGGQGDYGTGGAYNWDAVINEGVWGFTDNIAHNNDCGLRVWQNSTRNHVIENFIAYYNGMGIFHGAYANSYTYNGGIIYGNSIQVKAASANSNRVRFENMTLDGAGIIDYGFEVIHSPLPGDRPVFVRNVTIRGCRKAAIMDSAAPEIHSTDVVQCIIAGELMLYPDAAGGETIRVQPATGQPYQITKSGTNSIAPFAATIWGKGKGLKGEYFNSANFTNPALTRIDSNVSFSEWSAGVHYAIKGSTYSVRWTGQIMPQYSEPYTFYLGSGGGHRLWIDNKLILDSWTEHYPDSFASSPVTLVAGQLYDIKLEYFNTEGGTGIGLLWTAAGLPLEYVPQSQLYTDAITTPAPNQAPVANAGPDVVLRLPVNNTTLNGAASIDPDGSIVSYAWTLVSGPTQYTIASAVSVTTALTNLVAGEYVFRLKITDNSGAVHEDDVKITVNGASNQSPVAYAGSDVVISLPVNSTVLNGAASFDPDGKIVLYTWTKISGPMQYGISNPNAISPVITNLVEGEYVFRLQVKDDKGATAEDDVVILVKALPSDGTSTLTVKVAPNPSTSYFTLRITSNSSYSITIRIYDGRGNVVERITRSGTDITVTVGSTWRRGVYYATIEQGSVRRVVTLMKF